MNPLTKLTELFTQFPGIGPRQAKRFVYFLLNKNRSFTDELVKLLTEARKSAARCASCHALFVPRAPSAVRCDTCLDTSRETDSLMVVAREADMEVVERSETYHGHYFVLGGLLPALENEPEKYIRLEDLHNTIKDRAAGLSEIIFALPANPDGDTTARLLRDRLAPLLKQHDIKTSTLGRGLSTGLELEYSDAETLRNALHNRG